LSLFKFKQLVAKCNIQTTEITTEMEQNWLSETQKCFIVHFSLTFGIVVCNKIFGNDLYIFQALTCTALVNNSTPTAAGDSFGHNKAFIN